MEGDERVCVGAESGRVLKIECSELQFRLLPIAIVPLLAGHLAGPAADTPSGVNQSRLGVGLAHRLAHARPRGARETS